MFVSFFFYLLPRLPSATLFPYTTLFRSPELRAREQQLEAGVLRLLLQRLLGVLGGFRRTSRCQLDRRQRHVGTDRSEEHTSELQSLRHLVCRLLLEKKNNTEKVSTTP